MTDTNPRAVIGGNRPPVDTMAIDIDDLWDEAKTHLDGDPVTTEGQAEAVAKLLDLARKARKAADDQRKAEKQPYDDTIKAIQAAWNPLLEKCDLIAKTCKDALAPYQIAVEARQREAAEAARAEAEERQREAQAALAAARGDDLAAREDAERLLKEAGKASKAAAKLDKATPTIATGGRGIGLRTYWIAQLADPAAALKHYRETQPDALKAWLIEQAQRDANAGARAIPGFTIEQERRAA